MPVPDDFPEFYTTLDGDQRPAADHIGAHSVLFAGPGTGKTRTIKGKVLSLVRTHHIAPEQIIALAFTRVAANQLRNDLRAALSDGLGGLENLSEDGSEQGNPLISTIHGFALRQIIKNGDRIDTIPSPVRVSDDFFDRRVVIEDLAKLLDTGVREIKDELALLSASWEKNVSFDQLTAAFAARNPLFLTHWEQHRKVFGYTLRAEMVYQVKQALEQDPDFKLEDEFRQLIVDEFQDLNACDLALVKALASRGCEVTAAGDDDQSIYGFRYATPQAIRDFGRIYQGSSEFKLHVCHRCQKRILDLAHFVIRQDPARIDKGTVPRPGCPDGAVEWHSYANQRAEAEGIAEIITQLREVDGTFTKKILILLRGDRSDKYSQPIVDALTAAGIPVHQDDEVRPLDMDTGLLLRSLLELVVDEKNSMAWRVLLQLQKRNNVGDGALREVYGLCVADQSRFAEGLQKIVADPSVIPAGSRVATAVVAIRTKLAEFTVNEASLDEIIDRTLAYVTNDDSVRTALAADLQQERFEQGGDSLTGCDRGMMLLPVCR